jgi:hypothetical protein
MLANVLFKDNNWDKKAYANYLIKQMQVTDMRRSM